MAISDLNRLQRTFESNQLIICGSTMRDHRTRTRQKRPFVSSPYSELALPAPVQCSPKQPARSCAANRPEPELDRTPEPTKHPFHHAQQSYKQCKNHFFSPASPAPDRQQIIPTYKTSPKAQTINDSPVQNSFGTLSFSTSLSLTRAAGLSARSSISLLCCRTSSLWSSCLGGEELKIFGWALCLVLSDAPSAVVCSGVAA